MLLNAVQCSSMQFNAAQCSSMLLNAICHSWFKHDGILSWYSHNLSSVSSIVSSFLSDSSALCNYSLILIVCLTLLTAVQYGGSFWFKYNYLLTADHHLAALCCFLNAAQSSSSIVEWLQLSYAPSSVLCCFLCSRQIIIAI
jgi:hypothetical protein